MHVLPSVGLFVDGSILYSTMYFKLCIIMYIISITMYNCYYIKSNSNYSIDYIYPNMNFASAVYIIRDLSLQSL